MQSMQQKKVKYRCGSCSWKFSRNYVPRLCPYCGKASVEEDEADTSLMREVEVDKI